MSPRYELTARSPNILYYKWQEDASAEIVQKFKDGKKGVVLIGGTGNGKMYVKAHALAMMLQQNLLKVPDGSMFPFPILWLTPKAAKIQTMRVLQDYGILHHCMVMSYGQIKRKLGTAIFIDFINVIENGQEVTRVVWKGHSLPSIIVCDEVQKLKNPDSIISIVVRYAPENILWLGASATPWQRVVDARTALERCQVVTRKHNILPATKRTAPSILSSIAYPRSPLDYSPAAVERLREALDEHIVELKNVRYKFPAITRCISIQFKTQAQRDAYEDAYQEYLRECREKGKNTNHGWMQRNVAMLKFRQKAEILRCDHIAEHAIDATKKGKAVIIGSGFVDTLRGVWTHLRNGGINPNRIAFIVGGQSEKERQRMVDEFNDGVRDIMLLTVTAGGVAISLHHNKKHTKPRFVILPPTWSAIDLVQVLGRGHRLTSLSPTEQIILWYGGTIEDKVKATVERKMKCIRKSVIAKEQFSDIFEKARELTEQEERESAEEWEQNKQHDEANGNEDISDNEITGEGLENVENVPVGYYENGEQN